MRTRDKDKSLTQILHASQSAIEAISKVGADHQSETVNPKLFTDAKDAYAHWCKSVEWYMALSREPIASNLSERRLDAPKSQNKELLLPEGMTERQAVNRSAYKLNALNAKVLKSIHANESIDLELANELKAACEEWMHVIDRNTK